MAWVLPVGCIHGSRNRCAAVLIVRMRRATGMPELREHAPPFGLNRLHDLFPALDLPVGIDAGCAIPASGSQGDVGRLADNEAAVRSAIRIILKHHVAGNAPW